MCVPSPGGRQEEPHYRVCYAVAEGDGVGGEGVQGEVLGVALVVASEEGEDEEGEEEVDC